MVLDIFPFPGLIPPVFPEALPREAGKGVVLPVFQEGLLFPGGLAGPFHSAFAAELPADVWEECLDQA